MAPFWSFLLLAAFCLPNARAVLVRKDVEHLSDDDVLDLQRALRAVNEDTSEKGYAAIAANHGYPPKCELYGQKLACCQHGSTSFASWHRLYVVHMEQALKDKGLNIGVPYWDWTKPLTSLPKLVQQEIFIDPADGKARPNVWHEGDINIDGETKHTARAVDDRLFQKVLPGQHTDLFEQVLNALEQEKLCQFLVQYEVMHNTIHYLVGGPYEHSMSTLEFSSYDPIFFLHHSNLDRIFTLYMQMLYRRNAGKCEGACEYCDYQPMVTPMKPFFWDSNPFDVTKIYSSPVAGMDNNVLGYNYDDMTINGYDLFALEELLATRKTFDRSYAAFRLNGIKSSANVKVHVCVPSSNDQTEDVCEFAGDFFVLGGPLEMPWWFNMPYYYEITKTVQHLGVPLDGNYYVTADLHSVNGTHLPSNTFLEPYVSFKPAPGKKDPKITHNDHNDDHHADVLVRKDVDHLSREEIYELREALNKFEADTSVDGFQAIAEYHGDPPRCPHPNAKVRHACAVQGQFNFPHWSRLFVVQFEDALRRRGLKIGVPYWDWTKLHSELPLLCANETYVDPHTGEVKHNPFHDAPIGFLGSDVGTERDIFPQPPPPAFGDHTIMFDAVLLALEQDNFCDFEVQLEIAQNAIMAGTGGNAAHSMSVVSYAAYDPAFYLHRANVDRIWAIWTALQEYRGLPYKAHCGQSYVHQKLKPFTFSSPLNNNEKTRSHSVPTNIYDYEKELGYTYETLEYGGMSIPELDDYINKYNKAHARVFLGGLAWGTPFSGLIYMYIQGGGADKYFAGMFALIGGPTITPWRLDRQFRLDITDALNALGLKYNDPFTVIPEPRQMNGAPFPAVGPVPSINVIYKHAEIVPDHHVPKDITRKNVNELTREEIDELRHAMAELQADTSPGGFQDLGRYHGSAQWCEHHGVKVACCLHGMAAFPHWHRLWTVQAENALRRHNYHGAIPYWEWTTPLTALPALVADATYKDPATGNDVPNPFFSGPIADVGVNTVRSVDPKLYSQPDFGSYTDIAKQVMYAFEQDNFCDFEVHFEISHNFIHALLGGNEVYSMASLEYTSYDPIFYLHHANTDRNWAIWQALQKYRGKSYNSANCAILEMRKPMKPFSLSSTINPDAETRDNSRPFQSFDYQSNFHYHYDNLEFNGLSIAQLARELEEHKTHDRVFAGFILHGIKKSALVKFYICRSDDDCDHLAGEFYILGSIVEMPWSYDRLYKYEITDKLEELGLRYNDRYYIRYDVIDLAGQVVSTDAFPAPSVIYEAGTKRIQGEDYEAHASHVRKDLESLTEGEVESLRAAFSAIQKDHTYEDIASYHGKPGLLCKYKGNPVACCVHGKPTFPAWHRLYIEQVEEALLKHGSSVSVPYWDWTKPIVKLPDLISKATYYNSRDHRFQPNPFFSGKIAGEDAVTTRDPQPQLFNNDNFHEQVLLALEQDNFCDFEIQFELVHNSLHSWLGGRAQYSMSSLDYSAFDPVFFLHHSNTDRIWAIWQELQKYRGLPYNEADCALNTMRVPLKPFSDDIHIGDLTHKYSRPSDNFDYRNHFQYEYDNLDYHGMSIPQLDNLLHSRQRHGRVFAGFLLHNIGQSADVEIYVCVPTGPHDQPNCKTKAGVFSILGGELEMPFTFDRLYKYEITDTIRKLGLRLDSAAEFTLKIELHATNSSYLDPDLIYKPTISFVPGTDDHVDSHGQVQSLLVRKEIKSLSSYEEYSLIKAMRSLQADHSGDGYQSIAAFHAVPPLCPHPNAAERYACCRHGMASFPQWHRLYTFQMEDALRRHGAIVGVPYWDWARVTETLPHFFGEPTVYDPVTGDPLENPWYKASIDFENTETERDLLNQYIFERGPRGWDTYLFEQAMYALEQEDYCDFEIQFEVLHGAIHSWLGGSKVHSMAHLHYASYDPVFYIHHSNTDRLWAIWQALQEYRGLSGSEANCALAQMREPLKPFSFGPPYNLNPTTKEYARPEDTFDYKDHFNYRYDDLDFVGMSLDRLDAVIKKRQGRDRVFAGFLLKGFYSSALVDFEICHAGACHDCGFFHVLGGPAEMPWHFDRLYKYEITDKLKSYDIHFDDDYSLNVYVKYIDGTPFDPSPIPPPSVIIERAHHEHDHENVVTPNRVRHNVEDLSERDLSSLKSALHDLMEDEGPDGWASIASFRYQPGSPTYLHWNRLYLLQVEQALRRHGSSTGLPYWDWTRADGKIPTLLTDESYYDVWKDEVVKNPFVRGFIPGEDTYTVRVTVPEFFINHWNTTLKPLAYVITTAFEADNFCDFAVELDILSSSFRGSYGGYSKYSLFSLEYGQFDPAYLLTQTFIDKIWANWQEIQQRRGGEWRTADCALSYLHQPLEPFNDPFINTNDFTRKHAEPSTLFENERLGYAYDNFNLGGFTLEQGLMMYNQLKNQPRLLMGFYVRGNGENQVHLATVCQGGSTCTPVVGFTVIGGPDEKPWGFDRLYKVEVTIPFKLLGISPEDVFEPNPQFTVQMIHFDGRGQPTDSSNPPPRLIYVPQEGAAEEVHTESIAGIGVRKEISSLSTSEIKNLRHALQRVKDDHGPNGFQNIASFHGAPATRCTYHGKPIACCLHGMVSFPQWHRLYVKQWEDALTSQGANIGIPYWDWTSAFTALPSLVTDPHDNPFLSGTTFDGHETSRAPRDELFNDPEFGSESFFYRQALLMFEQTDYCDFEIQYEITHNAIHSWVGGRSPYGMSTLEYTAYDPLFLIHHSNADRQFAIWQALQKFRGLPYNSANCAIQHLKRDMRPFSDEDNVNAATRANSHPIDAFHYDRLNYQYDNLNFHGLTISELNDVLEKRKEEDRIFAEFLLHGIAASADVKFNLCDEHEHCEFAGTFAILGGPLEMPWAFDRLFKYDVTNVFKKLHLRPDDDYHFDVKIVAVNGTELDHHLIRKPSVEFLPGVKGHHENVAKHNDYHYSGQLVRKEINHLTLAETSELKNALNKMQQDDGPNGFEAIAGYHGYPYLCPEHGIEQYACCVHGMPIFPHWHRLFTLQFEQSLKEHGAHIGIPYWDWTIPAKGLPPLIGNDDHDNPFHDYTIRGNGKRTERNVSTDFFNSKEIHGYNVIFYHALLTLEEDIFCDFEVHFEMLHNEIHALVGGAAEYSMSTLDYSAFDPFFLAHHSATDRLWIIWQELQKLRHKPFNVARCGGRIMEQPLHPFNYPSINKNQFTRLHSVPNEVFDSSSLGYTYDKLELNGHDVADLHKIIQGFRSETRYFAAFTFFGIKTSCYVQGWLVDHEGNEHESFHVDLLGSAKEVPWAYERVYKHDVTAIFHQAGFNTDTPIDAKMQLVLYNGHVLKELHIKAAILVKPAHANYDVMIITINSDNLLIPKIVLKKNTRVKFLTEDLNVPMENLGSYTVFNNCNVPPFSYNTYEFDKVYQLPPGDYFFTPKSADLCNGGRKFQITIEDE